MPKVRPFFFFWARHQCSHLPTLAYATEIFMFRLMRPSCGRLSCLERRDRRHDSLFFWHQCRPRLLFDFIEVLTSARRSITFLSTTCALMH